LDTAVREQSFETEKIRAPHHWLRRGTVWILLLAGLLWAGDSTISLLVQHSRLRTKITARLEAAFGRRVDVGSYAFSIWGGPVLEADAVRIGEDPRFGNEYFMRANSITVRLRWWSLLRGHLALGTPSVNGASLNLVRSADGNWNLAEWLPKPLAGASTAMPARNPVESYPAQQFRRIEISDSRIDFKRGYEKLAFALVDVNGSMETDAPGRWRIDFKASPWRAAVITQQPGVIRVTGHIGGTSSRLRPAALQISWRNASISDFFRLARGDDYGIRGDVSAFISAHTEPSTPVNGWVLNGEAEISGLHRWDMASRPDNPSLNFVVKQALLDPGFSELRVSDLRIEAPHSNAMASVAFSWIGSPAAVKPAIASSDFVDLTSSQIDLGDLLDWVRAFHSGVPDGTSVRGMIEARAHFGGWPMALSSASLTSERAELIAPGLHGPARIGPIDLRYNRGAISLQPTTVAWSTTVDRAAASFRIDASARGRSALFPSWHVAGAADDVRGIVAVAAALGVNLSRGWDLQGPLSCDLRWPADRLPWDSTPVGLISLGVEGAKSNGASLRTPFLNLPVERIQARVEMKPEAREIKLASAKAFGSNWSGTFERRTADAEWRFALSADHLSAADLDRWLNPRWRESFLDRMLPFLGPPAKPILPKDLRANGSVSVRDFDLAHLALRHLTGALRIDGRHIEFSDAQGKFYGGEAGGLLRADLSAIPNYHADVDVSRVDGAALVAAAPVLAGLRAETIAGRISIDAKGATRGDLMASMACQGTARASGIELQGLNLEKASGAPSPGAEGSRIPVASAAFTCSKRAVQFQRLSLAFGEGRSMIGSGSVGFDRRLDIQFQNLSATAVKSAGDAVRLTGNLASPNITRTSTTRRGR
jgi:hypothetical protein